MTFLRRKCNLTHLCRQFWVYVPQLFSRKKLKQNTTIFLFIFSFSIIQFVSWKHYDSTYVNHIPRKLNEGIPLNRLLCIFLFCIYKFGKFQVCYVHLDKFWQIQEMHTFDISLSNDLQGSWRCMAITEWFFAISFTFNLFFPSIYFLINLSKKKMFLTKNLNKLFQQHIWWSSFHSPKSIWLN